MNFALTNRKALGLFTVTETCTLLGITRSKWEHFKQHGRLPYPTHTLGSLPRCYFNLKDIEALRRVFK